MNEIKRINDSPMVLAGSPEEASQFIRMALEKGTSATDMKTLFEMYGQMISDARKTAFDKAMTKFQADCPPMPRGHASHLKRVNAAGVQVASRYSDMADIAKTIAPALRDAGLSYEWEETELMEVGGQPYYRAHLRVRHENGYSERKSGPPIPIGKGNNNQSAQMQAAAVVTTAQRLALRSAFGLYSIDQDEEDAANAPQADTINGTQVDALYSLLSHYNENNSDDATKQLETRMLAAVGVDAANKIPADKFDYVYKKLAATVEQAKAKK